MFNDLFTKVVLESQSKLLSLEYVFITFQMDSENFSGACGIWTSSYILGPSILTGTLSTNKLQLDSFQHPFLTLVYWIVYHLSIQINGFKRVEPQ